MDNEQLHRQILERLTRIETNGEAMLVEARRTNGRVTKLEEVTSALQSTVAIDGVQLRSFIKNNTDDITEIKTHLNDTKTTFVKWKDWLIERVLSGVIYVIIGVLAAVGFIKFPFN